HGLGGAAEPANSPGVGADGLQVGPVPGPVQPAAQHRLGLLPAEGDGPGEQPAARTAAEDPEGVPATGRASPAQVRVAVPPSRTGVTLEIGPQLGYLQHPDQVE